MNNTKTIRVNGGQTIIELSKFSGREIQFRDLEINSVRRDNEVILFSDKAQKTELRLSVVSIFGT